MSSDTIISWLRPVISLVAQPASADKKTTSAASLFTGRFYGLGSPSGGLAQLGGGGPQRGPGRLLDPLQEDQLEPLAPLGPHLLEGLLLSPGQQPRLDAGA